MSRAISPVGTRDLALVGLLVAGLGALFALAGALMLGAAAVTAMVGGQWRLPSVSSWAPASLAMLADPRQPAVSLGPPWAPIIAAHPAMYWTATSVILVCGSLVIAAGTYLLWQRLGPSPAGHASREDIRRELSLAAARASAKWTRPSMTGLQRRRAPLDQVGVPLHRGPHHEVMVTPLENPTGALAPTQSGKTRRDLVQW